MLLTCNQCSHTWEDDPEDEATAVWCGRCRTEIPIAVALNPASAKANAAPTQPQRPVPAQAQGAQARRPEPTPPPDSNPPEIADAPTQMGPFSTVASPKTPPRPVATPPGTQGRPAPVQAAKTGQAAQAQPAPAQRTPAQSAPQRVAAAQKPAAPAQQQAAPKPKRQEKAPPKGADDLIGRVVDGYRIEKLLGAGGMGAVYLAHQLSLDRSVAIKVLPTKFADNPEFVARFTREALSAAQLTHHNIIQVHDVGSSELVHYISMEFVEGESLGTIIRRDGRLPIDTAAGYILQASRGLTYAHDRGIIHRDIKPDNMMLNPQGVIKIADMGLAKRLGDAEIPFSSRVPSPMPSASSASQNVELTGADMAMGTPAYMAPEQARDSRSVDSRADQYSLGCTLYYLCAGKAPFSGTTAFELISKHMKDAPEPLEVHVRGVPATFGHILERMLAKTPEGRYPSTADLVKELEVFLGVESEKGPFTPREQHVAILETAQKEYYSASAMKKRRLAIIAFFALMPLLFLGAVFLKQFWVAGGILGLTVLTPFAAFVLDGIMAKTFLFRRVRSLFFGMPIKSWAMTIGGAVLGIGALFILGLLLPWVAFSVLAVGLAAAYEWGVLKPLKAERSRALAKTQDLLRELRLRGLAEEALQDFMCRFSGEHWEEYFEELFGYEAMIHARGKWAGVDKAHPRKRFATWRDPIARWLDGMEEARKLAREKKQLAKVEAKRLKAAGATEKDAERQAAESATRIISEGFIHKSEKVKEEEAEEKKVKVEGKGRMRLAGLFIAFRVLFGLGVLAAYGAKFAMGSLPGPISSLLRQYQTWGQGGTWIAPIAGLALIATAFTRRVFTTWLVTLGAALLIFHIPLIKIVEQPQLNPTSATLGGLLLIVLGLAPAIMGKVTGGKF